MNKPEWLPNTPYLRFGLEHGEGWNDLVKPLVEYCKEHNLEILQIKEKFGGLRFYSQTDDTLNRLRQDAEKRADHTCERCGASTDDVKLRTNARGTWVKTLCDDCGKEW